MTRRQNGPVCGRTAAPSPAAEYNSLEELTMHVVDAIVSARKAADKLATERAKMKLSVSYAVSVSKELKQLAALLLKYGGQYPGRGL